MPCLGEVALPILEMHWRTATGRNGCAQLSPAVEGAETRRPPPSTSPTNPSLHLSASNPARMVRELLRYKIAGSTELHRQAEPFDDAARMVLSRGRAPGSGDEEQHRPAGRTLPVVLDVGAGDVSLLRQCIEPPKCQG
jgi:hypothetical protein